MSRLIRWQVAAGLATLCLGIAIAAQTLSQVTTAVSVSGNVERILSLTVPDLKRYPAHQVDYSPRRGTEEKPVRAVHRYVGCLLRDVLVDARPVESNSRELRKSYVVATASDGYEVVFSWAELFVSPVGESVFVVYERDGAPVPDDEGRIALIVTTDTRPARHVKWLRSLALRSA